jgi:hypothetical protein
MASLQYALVILPEEDPITEWMVEPFKRHRLRLLMELGLAVRDLQVKTLDDVYQAAVGTNATIVFASAAWHEHAEEVADVFSSLRRRFGTEKKLVYLDSVDQSSSPFFGILPYVDLYVKKQLLRDRTLYLSPQKTGYIVSDFVQEESGVDLKGWHFGSVISSESLLSKLYAGWNVATKKQLVRRLRADALRSRKPLIRRSCDVHYRVGLSDPDQGISYYSAHRLALSEALAGMEGRHDVVNVAGGEERLGPKEFRNELFNSKLCVSAFGWGEVTDRDYEIVINRSALVKPDMSHLETYPNIYVPGETYIPFSWDASDLVRVCEHYLDNLDEAQRIADAARRKYMDWVTQHHFVSQMGAILELLAR